MITFLSGAIMAVAAMVGLFFLKFWKKSGERLFLIFAVAFWLLAVERFFLLKISPDQEAQSFIYILRLMAFILIATGIVDINRRNRENVVDSSSTGSSSAKRS